MQNIIKKSKAGVLEFIKLQISRFNIPELLVFSVGDYSQNSHELISRIADVFRGRTVVVGKTLRKRVSTNLFCMCQEIVWKSSGLQSNG